jgi:5-methylcytosine-specific restriction endonuclease McrA
VVPRSKGGGDTWDNMVVACSSCNTKKGDRLLEHTGMKLAKVPRSPANKILLSLHKSNVNEWKDYIFV